MDRVSNAAMELYRNRLFDDGNVAIRLFAIGARRSRHSTVEPPVVQLTWNDVLTFVFNRFVAYRSAKLTIPSVGWHRQASCTPMRPNASGPSSSSSTTGRASLGWNSPTRRPLRILVTRLGVE